MKFIDFFSRLHQYCSATWYKSCLKAMLQVGWAKSKFLLPRNNMRKMNWVIIGTEASQHAWANWGVLVWKTLIKSSHVAFSILDSSVELYRFHHQVALKLSLPEFFSWIIYSSENKIGQRNQSRNKFFIREIDCLFFISFHLWRFNGWHWIISVLWEQKK